MNYYAFHIGDYAAATAHLNWEEDLAYRRLLDLYYTREESIPLDQRAVYRLTRAASQEQRAAVDAVLGEYFAKGEHGWVHQRCEDEIAKAREKSVKARQSAERRWENDANASKPTSERIQSQSEGNAPNPNPNPNPNHHPSSAGEFEKMEVALRSISGIDKHPVAANPDVSPIWQLVQSGLDLKTVIIPKIKAMLTKARPGSIKGWNYFAKVIVEDRPSQGQSIIDTAAWQKRLQTARLHKQWDVQNWGPMPQQPNCKVPANLLETSDGSEWKEWRAA